jgi:hypothetical protein
MFLVQNDNFEEFPSQNISYREFIAALISRIFSTKKGVEISNYNYSRPQFLLPLLISKK